MANKVLEDAIYYHESDSGSGRETYSERDSLQQDKDGEDWYAYADKLWTSYVWREIVYTFEQSKSLMRFDEINALDASVEVKVLFRKLVSVLIPYLQKIANHTRRRVADTYVIPVGEDGVSRAWVKNWMGRYNTVTKTQMTADIERRRSIMYEGLMVTPEIGKRGGNSAFQEGNDVYDRTRRAWERLVRQGAIDVEDDAAMEAYEEAGITKVQWVTEKDARVCETCQALDGQIFDLGTQPSKPHPRCRCHLIPVHS